MGGAESTSEPLVSVAPASQRRSGQPAFAESHPRTEPDPECTLRVVVGLLTAADDVKEDPAECHRHGPGAEADEKESRLPHLWLNTKGTGIVKISARNQLPGTVRTVTEGQVMAEVVVDVVGGHELVAAITAESVRRLGLAPGSRVVAVIKSTEVILAVED